jgi:hypothetical protein
MIFLGKRAVSLVLCLIFVAQAYRAAAQTGLPDSRDPLAGMGINIHFTDPRPGDLEMLSQAGFRWVRMDLHWDKTEKTAGVYDFSAFDRLLARLDQFHIRALLILDYANPLYDDGKPTCTDAGRAAFARWAVAAVTHFKNRGIIWEIWNEPNGDWFWKPKANADDYAKLALTVSKAIHDAAPQEVIVGPGLSGFDMKFVEVAARLGVLTYWSAITIHPYTRQSPETYQKAYDETRQLIAKYALPGQKIAVVCGESGYSTAWPEINNETQGKYLARLFLFNVISDVPLTIWYDWHDDGGNLKDQESNFGTVHFDYHANASPVYEPKPAYLAAQTYARELAGYRFKERLKTDSLGDYVVSFAKENTERACLVAWTTVATPHQVKIALPNGTYEITSYDGKKRTETAVVDGSLALTVDGGPAYIQPSTTD